MTGKKFVDLIRFLTGTNSNTFTDAEVVLVANPQKDLIARKLLKASEDVFLTPQTAPLVANVREYPLPENINASKIKKVEVMFDGVNWVPLAEMDLIQYDYTTDETAIASHFNNAAVTKGNSNGARYDISRNSINIYSGTIIAVDAGLKIHSEEYPADILAAQLADDTNDLSEDPTTTTYGLPKDFHELWTRMVSKIYKSSKEKPLPLTDQELQIDSDLAVAVVEFTPVSEDREDKIGEPTGDDTGNNGFDY